MQVRLEKANPVMIPELTFLPAADQAPVVQKVDSAIHWVNLCPLNSAIGFASTYPLDSDLSGGKRYPAFEQPGPEHKKT